VFLSYHHVHIYCGAMDTNVLSLEIHKRYVKLTTQFYLVPRLRMCGALPPLPCMHGFVLHDNFTLISFLPDSILFHKEHIFMYLFLSCIYDFLVQNILYIHHYTVILKIKRGFVNMFMFTCSYAAVSVPIFVNRHHGVVVATPASDL
jgi:hypothetical protein